MEVPDSAGLELVRSSWNRVVWSHSRPNSPEVAEKYKMASFCNSFMFFRRKRTTSWVRNSRKGCHC